MNKISLLARQCVAYIEDAVCNGYRLDRYPVLQKRPFALVIPGGAYKFVSNTFEGIPIAAELNRMGVHAFVLRYHTKQKGRYPVPQEEVARAIRYILDHAKEFNVETEGYSVWGFSAGGHLAACFGTDIMGYKNYSLPKPAALVLSYPVITAGEYAHRESFVNLFGEKEAENRDFASIEKQVSPDYPPTYVWCCEGDDIVPDENTRLMVNALQKNGVPYQSRIVKGIKKGHGVALGKGTAAEGWAEEAFSFWEKNRLSLR